MNYNEDFNDYEPGYDDYGSHYGDFAGSYAQDVEGYSDDVIYDAFDGDTEIFDVVHSPYGRRITVHGLRSVIEICD